MMLNYLNLGTGAKMIEKAVEILINKVSTADINNISPANFSDGGIQLYKGKYQILFFIFFIIFKLFFQIRQCLNITKSDLSTLSFSRFFRCFRFFYFGVSMRHNNSLKSLLHSATLAASSPSIKLDPSSLIICFLGTMADNSSDKIMVAPLSPIESILSLCRILQHMFLNIYPMDYQ